MDFSLYQILPSVYNDPEVTTVTYSSGPTEVIHVLKGLGSHASVSGRGLFTLVPGSLACTNPMYLYKAVPKIVQIAEIYPL